MACGGGHAEGIEATAAAATAAAATAEVGTVAAAVEARRGSEGRSGGVTLEQRT